MSVELQWMASRPASVFYAVRALSRGDAAADSNMAGALAAPVKQFLSEIRADDLPLDPLLDHLLPLSAQVLGGRELIERALTKTIGGGDHDARASRLSAITAEIDHAFGQQQPKIVEQLELRAPVLREQWEARGPGLLLSIRRLTDDAIIPPRADVVLVHPFLGGGGVAHLLYNQVTIEAVLANPHPDLPEVVRLGWLIAQLQMELPAFGEAVPGGRLPRLAALAMIPPTLAAAEQVELATCSPATIRLALGAWHVDRASNTAADNLWRWWEVQEATRAPWPVALAALDKLLGSAA